MPMYITARQNFDPILPQPLYPQAILVQGKLSNIYVFKQYGFKRVYCKYSYPYDPKDPVVVANREKFAQAVANWQGFDQPTRHFYNIKNYPNIMSGYNRYIHYYMKAN